MHLREALAFARKMSHSEDVSFTTQATITCKVDISMNNRPDEGVSVFLSFPEFDGISLSATVNAQYIAVPSSEELSEHNQRIAETGEGSLGLPISSVPVTLSAEEVCRIFNIPESAEWEMSNHVSLDIDNGRKIALLT